MHNNIKIILPKGVVAVFFKVAYNVKGIIILFKIFVFVKNPPPPEDSLYSAIEIPHHITGVGIGGWDGGG